MYDCVFLCVRGHTLTILLFPLHLHFLLILFLLVPSHCLPMTIVKTNMQWRGNMLWRRQVWIFKQEERPSNSTRSQNVNKDGLGYFSEEVRLKGDMHCSLLYFSEEVRLKGDMHCSLLTRRHKKVGALYRFPSGDVYFIIPTRQRWFLSMLFTENQLSLPVLSVHTQTEEEDCLYKEWSE